MAIVQLSIAKSLSNKQTLQFIQNKGIPLSHILEVAVQFIYFQYQNGVICDSPMYIQNDIGLDRALLDLTVDIHPMDDWVYRHYDPTILLMRQVVENVVVEISSQLRYYLTTIPESKRVGLFLAIKGFNESMIMLTVEESIYANQHMGKFPTPRTNEI